MQKASNEGFSSLAASRGLGNISIMKLLGLFTLLAFTISWAFWAPVIALRLHTTQTPAGAILFLLGGFGPSVAGAIFIVRGSGGRELVSRIFSPRRIGLLEITVALFAYPAVFAASVGISRLFGAGAPGFAGLAGMLASPGPSRDYSGRIVWTGG